MLVWMDADSNEDLVEVELVEFGEIIGAFYQLNGSVKEL